MMVKSDFYFTIRLTETEHNIVRESLIKECCNRNFKLIYYRKFKNGHVPTYRECKIEGNVSKIKQMLKELNLEIGNINKKTILNGKKIPIHAYKEYENL